MKLSEPTVELDVEMIGDFILVSPEYVEDTTPGGIQIPEVAKKKPNTGRVVACGPGIRDTNGQRCPLQIKVGDMVMFGGGTNIKVQGEEVVAMHESNLILILPESD